MQLGKCIVHPPFFLKKRKKDMNGRILGNLIACMTDGAADSKHTFFENLVYLHSIFFRVLSY